MKIEILFLSFCLGLSFKAMGTPISFKFNYNGIARIESKNYTGTFSQDICIQENWFEPPGCANDPNNCVAWECVELQTRNFPLVGNITVNAKGIDSNAPIDEIFILKTDDGPTRNFGYLSLEKVANLGSDILYFGRTTERIQIIDFKAYAHSEIEIYPVKKNTVSSFFEYGIKNIRVENYQLYFDIGNSQNWLTDIYTQIEKKKPDGSYEIWAKRGRLTHSGEGEIIFFTNKGDRTEVRIDLQHVPEVNPKKTSPLKLKGKNLKITVWLTNAIMEGLFTNPDGIELLNPELLNGTPLKHLKFIEVKF